MDNDRVNPSQNNDEEYQFTDDVGAQKYESSAATPASSSSIVQNGDNDGSRRKKIILIIIGIVLGVFCLYKLYGLFTVAPSKTPLAPAQVEATTSSPATEGITSVAEENAGPINPPQLPPVLSEEKFDKENFQDKMVSLEKAVVQNSETQENLQNQIGGISSAVTEIQNNIALLTQQLNMVVQQKNEHETKLQEKIEAAHKVKEAKKPHTRSSSYHQHREKKINDDNYYVKAMIQGRAWLVNSSGATLTISTGDQLAGYGEIREINPDKGIVTTSSGRVLGHMSQDR